jgi:ABC-type nitrate/sulfonate/bicarbonate transport system permease component
MTRLAQRKELLLFPVSIAGGLALWEMGSRLVPSSLLPPPSAVAMRLLELTADGSLPLALLSSLQHMVIGYLIAVALAVPIGILLGRSPSAATALEPVLNALYAIPPVAFVPFLIVWFGLYMEGRIALVVAMCFFEILINVHQGVKNIDRGLIETAVSFGSRGVPFYRMVILPASMPFIFTGLRVGMGRAVNAMITAELFFAAVNLGEMLKNTGNAFDTASMFAIIVTVSVFGLVCQEGVRQAERLALPWHHREAP